jgi:hypothetical protein
MIKANDRGVEIVHTIKLMFLLVSL